MKSKHINWLARYLAVLCLLSVVLFGCSNTQTTTVPSIVPSLPAATRTSLPTSVPSPVPLSPTVSATYWPTETWRTSSPEAQGMDSRKIEQMLAAIEQKGLAFHSLLVIRNGYLVSETYFGSYTQDTKQDIYSCTKSFVSTLIGIAIDRGIIEHTDQRIIDFFPDRTFANLDEQKKAMTLEDMLTMRSGLDWQEGGLIYSDIQQSNDWIGFVLDRPMVQAPGQQFNYCSGCSHVLSGIMQQTSGMNMRDFAEQSLFKPLGISNIWWG